MLSDRYEPKSVEKKLYAWWREKGYFSAEDVSTKPPFSIVLPPPNVTGSLHLGHALDHTIQDTLARWKRMRGYNVCWLPGTDHAGIATQSVVEKKLAKEGISRKDLGREKFVDKIWEWKEQYGGTILSQMERLGDSVDWDRLTFTLDDGVSKAVRKVFVELYNKHLIYRGQKLINWSPALESAISDLEVEYKEVKGKIFHIRYPLVDGSGEVVVATTRPETLLGDVAVAVHPEDERYQNFIGRKLKLPLTDREIPVIADEAVDKDFGSGVVKITPAHDFNDYEMGLRHGLEQINILNKDGTLNAQGGKFKGLKVQEARKQVLKALEEEGSLLKEEVHVHQVGHCSRTGVVVEPFLSEQWFVKTGPLAEPAKRVVESGTIVFEPESWTKTYLHWMNNIQDWCISRQLWWGHRIPAWYCNTCDKVTVSETDPKSCSHCKSTDLRQDEDVLDTWFSSALWPFSTFGWPNQTESLKTFYPTTLLVTGFDIIFFWVARMIMLGLEFQKDVPFRTVYIHGLIRDSEGKKMSKSVGNALDPVELIEEFGADSLRFTLMAQIQGGRDLKFSTQRLEGYRNFMNKIWNATRFSLTVLEGVDFSKYSAASLPNKVDLSDADQWILFKLKQAETEVHEALENYRFSDAANSLYSFVWHSFCDWYLEFIKPTMYGPDSNEKQATQLILAQLLNRIMRLLHPFTPFITEEIFQKLPIKGEAVCIETYPDVLNDKALLELGSEKIADEMDLVREAISAVRNIRGENRIKPGEKIKVLINPHDDQVQKILGANKGFIMSLGKLASCEIGPVESMNKCAVQPISVKNFRADVVIPLEGLVDLDEEIKRLQKTIEKVMKEQVSLSQRLSNKNFVANAPEEVVAQGKEQLEEKSLLIKTLQDQLTRLT